MTNTKTRSHNAPNAILTQENNQVKASTFDQLKRDFEQAYLTGDYEQEILSLAQAITHSVLRKLYDPQAKRAKQTGEQVNAGCNPLMLKYKQGIIADHALLVNTADSNNKATALQYNDNGDLINAVTDKSANEAVGKLVEQTLSDSSDMVQTVVLALLEMAQKYCVVGNWLDLPRTENRLSKKVYIKRADSLAYSDTDIVPIVEVTRTLRRYIMDMGGLKTDPKNSYIYLQEWADNGIGELEKVYRRLGKCADIGGYETATGDYHSNGNYGMTARYTADEQTADDMETLVAELDLTARQAQILELRLQGYGKKAIATYLGVTQRAIAKTTEQVREKARRYFGVDVASKFIKE